MRLDIRAILREPEKREAMCVDAIIALQAREGIETTREQALAAYRKVQAERQNGKPLRSIRRTKRV